MAINTIKTWSKRNTGEITTTNENRAGGESYKRLTWATQFKNILRLGKKERVLAPKASITYSRPPTLKNKLTKFKQIAMGETTSRKQTGTYSCGQCGLCGNYGVLENMVMTTNTIPVKRGKVIQLKATLNCKDHGIYAARCRNCSEFYVGQTKNSFATRWSSHRHNWNKMREKGNVVLQDEREREQNALFLHYVECHRPVEQGLPKISDAYRVIFLERPRPTNLDIRESFWVNKLDASINIMKTILPRYQ